MLIWGSKARTKTEDQGEFYCPECKDYKDYETKRVKKYFTIYFIPTFPTDDLGEYVECQTCESTFNKSILENDPKQREQELLALYVQATRDILVSIAMSDGHVDPSEIKEISKCFESITNRSIDKEQILETVATIEKNKYSLQQITEAISPYLNNSGKEKVLRGAIMIAKADKKVVKKELDSLHKLTIYLDIPKAYANGIFDEGNIKKLK